MDRPSVNLPAFRQTPLAVAIDLDGTLLNRHTRISPRNAAAFLRATPRAASLTEEGSVLLRCEVT
jgi:hypothetical protein